MLLGAIGSILLVFLPGAWITFGLPLKGFPYWAKVLTGAMLAPLVVAIQFYALRLVGVPFESCPSLLVLLNLPALYLILRRLPRLELPDRRTLVAIGLVVVVVVASTAPFLLDAQKRLYTWEAWSQADVVYSLANGNLVLDDADLAGMTLSYPWAGHVYQAVLSYVIGTAPVANYIWFNYVWLAVIFGFAAGIVAELGGNSLSQVTVAIWLSFGVNFVGAVVGPLVPRAWITAHPILGNIWGDNRYTPWLDKVVFFGQMYFALGLFIAVVYLMIRPWFPDSRLHYLLLTGFLLTALGVIYPVLLPAACAVVGARALAILLRLGPGWPRISAVEIVGLGAACAVAAVITYAEVRFLTAGRASASLFHLHNLREIRWTTVETIVVTSPLLAGFGFCLLRLWRGSWQGSWRSLWHGPWREAARIPFILGLGALVSFVPYILFDIPWYRNEYKFVFTAAICLAAFPSLALEPVLERLRRLAVPAMAVTMIVLAAPLAHNVYTRTYVAYTRHGPTVDTQQFALRLDSQEPLAGLLDAIRTGTPVQTLVVVQSADLHLPTLTERDLYVAPAQTVPSPGILISNDEMLTLVKGYPAEVVAERRADVQSLYTSDDPAKIRLSLSHMVLDGRPLALILDDQTDGHLREWLAENRIGRSLYAARGFELWFIEAREVASAHPPLSSGRAVKREAEATSAS